MRCKLLMLIAAVGLIASAIADAAGTAGPVDSGKPQALPEVTVLAQLKLEPKVLSFVDGIVAVESNEELARWNAAVCPLVSGLPRAEGEFLLGRVSEIARAAAVPLAGEKCHPNLFVFVTNHPKELAQDLDQHHHSVVFANATPLDVAQFIDTPRPVRVWYSTYTAVPGSVVGPIGGPPTPDVQVLGAGMVSNPTYYGPGMLGSSHVDTQFTWSFSYVYVLIDQRQLHGMSRGQLADYVAMVSLAEIKPNAHTGNTQSILTLFADGPQASPAGVSSWDQAFLKSLYVTDQASRLQRQLITRSMARELVPQ